MKKTLHLKVCITLLSLFSFFTVTTSAQALLVDNFSYNNGNLVGQGGWAQQDATTTDPLQIVDTLLVYEGYQEEGSVGKSITLGNKGEDAYKEFPQVSSGDIYFAALINFSEVQAANTTGGDYFLSLGEGGESVYNIGRVFVRKSVGGDKMIFGISRATTGSTAAWADTEFELGKTHLVVVKFTIVDGDKNDIVSLYVNPPVATEPITPLVVFSSTGSGSSDSDNIKSIVVRQGATTRTPLGYIGAVRVAKTWADLMDGTVTPVVETPKITASSKYIVFGDVYPEESVTKIVNIKGEHLKGDITISGLTTGELSGSATKITKEQAESENGYDLTLTLTPQDINNYTDDVLFDSPEAIQEKVSAYWTTATLAENISEVRSIFETNQYTSEVFKVKNNVLVSHVYTGDSKPIIYVQDAESALAIQDLSDTLKTTYKEGDQILISGTMDKVWGATFFYPTRDFDAPVSENNVVTPLTITLAELIAEPLKYEARLIKVEDISFYNRANENSGIFQEGTNNKISQNGTNAAISVFKGADYVGKTIPEIATLTGIFRSVSAKLIAPRYEADIVTPFVNIENNETESVKIWSDDAVVHIVGDGINNVEIYNTFGHKIVDAVAVNGLFKTELNAGVYIIKASTNSKGYVKKIVIK